MRARSLGLLGLVAAIVAIGCTPAAPSGTSSGSAPASPGSSAPSRTLNMGVRYEVIGLASKRLEAAASEWTKRTFNASLAVIDGTGTARPYLADKLPELNTNTWIVSPDGKMETSYALKALTWQDGQPLTADDFVFANMVYTVPGLGAFTSSPQDQIDEILAPDSRTLVIRWKSLYGDAGALTSGLLDPLPRHLLEAPFETYEQDTSTRDAFLANPFWTTQYIGLGPYKLVNWIPGASFEGVAFDGHALGKPKIDRVVINIFSDEQTALSNLLSGAIEIAGDTSMRFEQAMVIHQQWEPTKKGVALMRPGTRHWVFLQFRPDLLQTHALLDVRVRKALMTAIDRSAINDGVFENQGVMGEHFVPPQMPYFNDVEKAVAHYPFDPTRVAQFMTEAGFTKDSSGMYAGASGEHFRPQWLADGSPTFEREMNIVQGTWASLGIDMDPKILPAVESRNLSARTTFPDMYASSTGIREAQLDIFSEAQIATAQRGWAGNNRGGWSNPDYEKAWLAFNTTLDRSERNARVVDMMKAVMDDLPGLMLYFNITPIAYSSDLTGPEMGTPETLANWNMSDWQLK